MAVPVLGNLLFGSFTHYDESRSKETLTPKSQAWAGYSQEIMSVVTANKAEPLLAAELDLDELRAQVRSVFWKNWAGHEKFASWGGMKSSYYDEFGTDVRTLPSYSKDDVLNFLVRGKEIVQAFTPRSSLLATEGFKDLGIADSNFVADVAAHKKSLRAKLTQAEAEVYNELLTSGRPSLIAFAKEIAKLAAGDTLNASSIRAWANQIAQGTLPGVPTQAAPHIAAPVAVAWVANNTRMIARVYGIGKSTENVASRV